MLKMNQTKYAAMKTLNNTVAQLPLVVNFPGFDADALGAHY